MLLGWGGGFPASRVVFGGVFAVWVRAPSVGLGFLCFGCFCGFLCSFAALFAASPCGFALRRFWVLGLGGWLFCLVLLLCSGSLCLCLCRLLAVPWPWAVLAGVSPALVSCLVWPSGLASLSLSGPLSARVGAPACALPLSCALTGLRAVQSFFCSFVGASLQVSSVCACWPAVCPCLSWVVFAPCFSSFFRRFLCVLLALFSWPRFSFACFAVRFPRLFLAVWGCASAV